jgi:hypothetical protein
MNILLPIPLKRLQAETAAKLGALPPASHPLSFCQMGFRIRT